MHFSKIGDALRWQKQQSDKAGRLVTKQKKALWKRFGLPLMILAIAGILFVFNSTAAFVFLSTSVLSVGIFYKKK